VFCGQYWDELQALMELGLTHMEPAGHGWGAAEPLRHRLPCTQTTGLIAPVVQYEPAGQVEQEDIPGVGLLVPAGHCAQWPSCEEK